MTSPLFSDKERMLDVNKQQAQYYESRYAAAGSCTERAANTVTNLWTWLRRRQQSCHRALGVQQAVLNLHRCWAKRERQQTLRVLDLGCFSGNALSLELARGADSYLGIDLCTEAIASLRAKLAAAGLEHARAEAMDFLNNDFSPDSFDVVYAHSVMHHFRYFECFVKELHRVLAPGGRVISLDPLNTSWSIWLARLLYRPMQSDRDWEYPFTMATFRVLERHFDIKECQGVMGCSKYAVPLMLVPGLKWLGTPLGRWGARVDRQRARRPGFWLRRCLQVTLLLEKSLRQ